MSKLGDTLNKLKEEGRAAFIPYITAGDPTLADTKLFIRSLVKAGADIIELGLPFSDPIADGPTNQRAAERALEAGTTVAGIFDLVKEIRQEGINTPIVLFTYFNPVLRPGLDSFAQRAAEAGVTGLLIVDLPPEEADEYKKAMTAKGLETVFLTSPTTAKERLRLIDESTTGFVYYVSRLGVTGKRQALPETICQEVEAVRSSMNNPVVIGFGISTPEHVRQLAPHTDGVVVGSALVKLIADNPPQKAAAKLEELVTSLVEATRWKR